MEIKDKYIIKILVFTLLIISLLCPGAKAVEQYNFERNNPLSIKPQLTTNYGEFRARTIYTQHDGLDYAVEIGKSVFPIANGTVTAAVSREIDGWGKYVIVTSTINGKTFETRYAHLSKVHVKTGDIVGSEVAIGLSGNTGNSTGPHLHFSFGLTASPSDTRNPIISGLKQEHYGNAFIAPIDSRQKIESNKIENCILFFDATSMKRVNNSIAGKSIKIIAEAYHNLARTFYKTNPYKIKFTIRKIGRDNDIAEKEIIFDDLNFNQVDYYYFLEPFRTANNKQKYNEYYYMDWTPTEAGIYEVEVKAYVAYWDGNNLIAPTASNPDLGLTDTKIREITIAEGSLSNLVDPTGMYAWAPSEAETSAAGVSAMISWPAPKFANDLSNTIFTTNSIDVDPDAQKYTEFTYSASRNADFTVRIKDQSGMVKQSLYAGGTEGGGHNMMRMVV